VVGAKVIVTSVQKSTPFQTVSNQTGNYYITHLIPDQYDIRASGPGFKTFEARRIPVYADQAARVDVRFQVGAAEEIVTVSAEEVPLLKTDRADVSTTFTERQVKALPLYDRNFTLLALLTPGTTRAGFQHSSAENPQGSSQIMVNGQHFGGTSYQLDGTDNRDPILGIIVINPTLESVTEAKMTSQNYEAEFGQAVAGVVGEVLSHPGPLERLGDRQPRGVDAARVAVALRVADVVHHVAEHGVRGTDPEGGRVAEVELENVVPVSLELPGTPEHWPPDVVPDVLQPARLRHHDCPPSSYVKSPIVPEEGVPALGINAERAVYLGRRSVRHGRRPAGRWRPRWRRPP